MDPLFFFSINNKTYKVKMFKKNHETGKYTVKLSPCDLFYPSCSSWGASLHMSSNL